MPDPAIQVDSLSYSYGRRLALDGISISVDEGEIFGFLGPNGSGKTTLFRILSTLIPAPAGKVRMLGMDLAENASAIRPSLAVVFQSPSLDLELSAEENLRHHGHLYGLRGRDLHERIRQMLTRFDLADRRAERAKTFSGGMRRRVELAKGLLTRPRILLMDEPSTGLDPTARIEMWRWLNHAREEDGMTILVTTHLMDEADRCDRLAIMDKGRLVVCGTPAELKDRVGGDVITLAGPDLNALKAAIQERFSTKVEQLDGKLRIERPRAHEFVPQLVEAMPGLIQSISIGKPTLEDVFIDATGHRFKDEMD